MPYDLAKPVANTNANSAEMRAQLQVPSGRGHQQCYRRCDHPDPPPMIKDAPNPFTPWRPRH